MILWLEAAPKYGVQDNKSVCDFIDKHITVDLPCNCLSEIPPFVKCQIHRHTFTCKKKNRRQCRFGFPHKPFSCTTILEPLNLVDYVKRTGQGPEGSEKDFEEKVEKTKKKLQEQQK